MDGENNGKPYEQMDDSGGKKTLFFGNTHINRVIGFTWIYPSISHIHRIILVLAVVGII